MEVLAMGGCFGPFDELCGSNQGRPPSAVAPFVWLVIAVSRLILRRQMGSAAKGLELKIWFFPYLTRLSSAVFTARLVGMVIVEQTREALLLLVGLAAIVVAIGVYRYRKDGRGSIVDVVLERSSEVPLSPAPKE